MKRTELKRGKPLRQMSAKRRKAHATRVRPGHGIPSSCEMCELLSDVVAYQQFASGYPDYLYRVMDPHHVFLRELDDPCNVVTACRVCHDFDRQCWSRAMRLVSAFALVRAGRFDRDKIRAAWDRDPVDVISADYGAGYFNSDEHLDAIATVFLEGF